jgi:hypothetical protein
MLSMRQAGTRVRAGIGFHSACTKAPWVSKSKLWLRVWLWRTWLIVL